MCSKSRASTPTPRPSAQSCPCRPVGRSCQCQCSRHRLLVGRWAVLVAAVGAARSLGLGACALRWGMVARVGRRGPLAAASKRGRRLRSMAYDASGHWQCRAYCEQAPAAFGGPWEGRAGGRAGRLLRTGERQGHIPELPASATRGRQRPCWPSAEGQGQCRAPGSGYSMTAAPGIGPTAV